MLEVAFDNGVAGGLRIAKDSRPGDKYFCITAPIYPKGTPPEQRETPRQETCVWQGADLGGSAEDVAPLELALDIGDLSGPADMDLKNRRKVLEDLYSPPPAGREDAHEKYLEKVWSTSVKTLERLRNTGGCRFACGPHPGAPEIFAAYMPSVTCCSMEKRRFLWCGLRGRHSGAAAGKWKKFAG